MKSGSIFQGSKGAQCPEKLWWCHIFLAESLFLWWVTFTHCVAWCPYRRHICICLAASCPPELHLLFPSDSWSKVISNHYSSLEVQVQVYANIDKDMLQSFDTETIHGMQCASFASTSEQRISYTLTFFACPNSVFQCSSNVFFAKLKHVRLA